MKPRLKKKRRPELNNVEALARKTTAGRQVAERKESDVRAAKLAYKAARRRFKEAKKAAKAARKKLKALKRTLAQVPAMETKTAASQKKTPVRARRTPGKGARKISRRLPKAEKQPRPKKAKRPTKVANPVTEIPASKLPVDDGAGTQPPAALISTAPAIELPPASDEQST